jgi:hypothetical protein
MFEDVGTGTVEQVVLEGFELGFVVVAACEVVVGQV